MATKNSEATAGTRNIGEKQQRRRVKVTPGQIVAVPLLDGSFALAHVAHLSYLTITLAHFAHRATSPDKLLDGLGEAMAARLLAIMDVTSDEIRDGHWPVIGHKEPTYPAPMLDMKGSSSTASISRALFDAYYGLRPWDGMHDPRYFEKKLLSDVPVPPTVRYKRDFEMAAAAQAAAAATTSTSTATENTGPAITEGPGVIHIEIKYDGDGLPSMELLHRRQAIEEGLESAGAGTVTDAGGGGGIMDIYLETKDVAHAMPFAHAAIKAVGFEKDARIAVEPMSEDEEPEDDDDDSEEQDDH